MKKIPVILLVCFFHSSLWACTTFFICSKDAMVFGRNYDWVTDLGMVNSNLKGLSKTSLKTAEGETISWVSRYGSITFNQYGKEFPTGGMNEKGLVVELMWLDETKYPAPDHRPAIGVLQWIQYQLDNCSTIEEVIQTDKKLRIASTGTTPLHYLVADANGQAATIEFLEGKMTVHQSQQLPLPVLTNSIYGESLKQYRAATGTGSGSSFAFGNNSLERFSKACERVEQFRNGEIKKPVIEYAFDILQETAQGNATKWSIVYDVKMKKIHFKTHRFSGVKVLDFSRLSFDCRFAPKSWDMNQEFSGNISEKMEDYNASINESLLIKAFGESSAHINVGEKAIAALSQYPAQTRCQ
jgi:choloylglycine hydrolase